MTRFFVEREEMLADALVLTGENAQHAKVLRLKAGEEVLVCDGEGQECLCRVADFDGVEVNLEVLVIQENGNSLFGMTMYPAQFVSAVACIITAGLVAYVRFVVIRHEQRA